MRGNTDSGSVVKAIHANAITLYRFQKVESSLFIGLLVDLALMEHWNSLGKVYETVNQYGLS